MSFVGNQMQLEIIILSTLNRFRKDNYYIFLSFVFHQSNKIRHAYVKQKLGMTLSRGERRTNERKAASGEREYEVLGQGECVQFMIYACIKNFSNIFKHVLRRPSTICGSNVFLDVCPGLWDVQRDIVLQALYTPSTKSFQLPEAPLLSVLKQQIEDSCGSHCRRR